MTAEGPLPATGTAAQAPGAVDGSLPVARARGRETASPPAALARWARWLAVHPQWLVISLGMAAVAVLGRYHLGAKSLWLDEGFAVAVARRGWADLWTIVWGAQASGNMLLYHLMQHLWLSLGDSEATFRGLSVVLAVLTIPPFYYLADRLFGHWTAAAAVCLLAANAFFIQYAQEARGYALLTFLAVSSSALLLRALDRPSAGRWAAYVVAASLALYAHYFATLLILAQFVSLLARRPRLRLRDLLAVYGAIGLAFVPLYLAARAQGMAFSWVPALTLDYARGVLETLLGSTGDLLLPVSFAAVCGAGVFIAVVRRQWRWEWLFAVSLGVVPIAAALVISLVRPTFVARYLIVALPGLVLLAAAGLSMLGSRWLRTAALVALAVLALDNLAGWYTVIPKEDWRDAIAYVASHSQPGDAMIVYPNYSRLPVDYYVEKQPAASAVRPLYPTPAWGQYFPGQVDGPTMQLALSADQTAAVKRIWLVYRYSPPAASTPDGQTLAATTLHRLPVSDQKFPYVGVQLFQIAP